MRLIANLICAAVVASPAFAVGSSDDTPPTQTETTQTCDDGQIFDKETGTCVDADAQSFNDDDRYKAVRELAYAGRLDSALKVIAAADDPDDARFLNYRGFILRQSGQMDRALAYYSAALRHDPNNILARSYMGIGLAEMGHKTAARAQLAEIAARSGRQSWPYRALSDVLNGKPNPTY